MAERGLAVPSGVLVVAGRRAEVDRAARLRGPAGPRRAVVTVEDLGRVSPDGLEGNEGRAARLRPGGGSRDVVVRRQRA